MPAATDTTPRVWVGCLACYNAGALIGEWVDASRAGDVTTQETHAHWAGKAEAPWETHEELCVFDHENFRGLLKGECSPAEAQRLAEILEELEEDQREAFAAWVEMSGEPAEDALPIFQEAYRGEWDSFEHYAEELAEDVGLLAEVSEALRPYVAIDRWARDLILGGDYWTSSTGRGTVHVFSS